MINSYNKLPTQKQKKDASLTGNFRFEQKFVFFKTQQPEKNMKSIGVVLFLSLIGVSICQINPGVASTLTQSGLDYGNTNEKKTEIQNRKKQLQKKRR